jgi:peroxiredoxin family protein
MPPEQALAARSDEQGPDKLSVIVLSHEFERVHYALVLASAVAAIGKPATLFFTGQALRALQSEDGEGAPGWRSLSATDGKSGGAADDDYRARGVAGFEELLSACVDLGVRFIACEMGLRAMRLEASALRSDVPIDVAGVVTLMGDVSAHAVMLAL